MFKIVEFACGLNDGVDGTSRFCTELVEFVETSVVSSSVVALQFPSVVKLPGSTIEGFEAIVVSSKIIKNYYIEVSNLTFSNQF